MIQDSGVITREVLSVRRSFEKAFETTVPQGTVDLIIRHLVLWAGRARRLSLGERGIVTLLKPKTAALATDRVWLPHAGHDTRLDFAFGFGSREEVRFAALWALFDKTHDTYIAPPDPLSIDTASFVKVTERDVAEHYLRNVGASVAPLYPTTQARDLEYRPGNTPAIVTVIDNLAVASEAALTWAQVLEFRSDSDTRAAYRRFVHWLDRDMTGRSPQFIVDEIAERMERYHWALHKHGIQTVIGVLSRTLDAQQLLGGAAAALTVQALAQQPVLSALSGLGIIVGKAALSAAATMVDRRDLRHTERDIAFVHELKGAFGTPKHEA